MTAKTINNQIQGNVLRMNKFQKYSTTVFARKLPLICKDA